MVKNLSKNTVLAKNLDIPRSMIGKIKGMIGSSAECMLFKTRFGIHTFFMGKKIDILILDKDKKVVDLREKLSSGKFFFWNPKYDTVIEFNAGILERSKTQVGDILSFD